nr:uncharacterized protein LOC104092447 [Nicotiana tomentosiformis]
MKRWLFEKVKKDRPDPFQIKDRPVVHPFLYPTKAEKMEPYIQNLIILSDKEDMMINNLSKELDGVKVLRNLGGAHKIEKGSLQTPQVGDSHVVGGYDEPTEKSIGGDGKMGGEVVDDDDGDGGMHFNEDNDRGVLIMMMANELLLWKKTCDEIKDRVVMGKSSFHCPCICHNYQEKEKGQIKWRDDMQRQSNLMNDQLNSMQKTMDDLVQKLSKRHVVLPRAIQDPYTGKKKEQKEEENWKGGNLHSSQ